MAEHISIRELALKELESASKNFIPWIISKKFAFAPIARCEAFHDDPARFAAAKWVEKTGHASPQHRCGHSLAGLELRALSLALGGDTCAQALRQIAVHATH